MKTEKLRILLIGYGKMGKAIETVAKSNGHSISAIISDKQMDLSHICKAYQPNIAFEFTSPESAVYNLESLIDAGIPIVCGSTGWLQNWGSISEKVKNANGTLFYASNFSLGMNLMFYLTQVAGKFMSELPEYEVEVEEIHHLEKKDVPSGTAITLAEKLIKAIKRKEKWVLNQPAAAENEINISALREPEVPGTHLVSFSSSVDTIEIIHTAHSRMGFATGAIKAGEWVFGKKGVFSMEDMLHDAFKQ
jgi:4-hydroxy-tetrahydrodipicolinate reductase